MILTYYYKGNISPKPRPRFDNRTKHTHLPNSYIKWRNEFEPAIYNLTPTNAWEQLPLTTATVEIKLLGKIRGDLDNLSGGILDALVTLGILFDDRVGCLTSLTISHDPTYKEKGAIITITRVCNGSQEKI